MIDKRDLKNFELKEQVFERLQLVFGSILILGRKMIPLTFLIPSIHGIFQISS